MNSIQRVFEETLFSCANTVLVPSLPCVLALWGARKDTSPWPPLALVNQGGGDTHHWFTSKQSQCVSSFLLCLNLSPELDIDRRDNWGLLAFALVAWCWSALLVSLGLYFFFLGFCNSASICSYWRAGGVSDVPGLLLSSCGWISVYYHRLWVCCRGWCSVARSMSWQMGGCPEVPLLYASHSLPGTLCSWRSL